MHRTDLKILHAEYVCTEVQAILKFICHIPYICQLAPFHLEPWSGLKIWFQNILSTQILKISVQYDASKHEYFKSNNACGLGLQCTIYRVNKNVLFHPTNRQLQ